MGLSDVQRRYGVPATFGGKVRFAEGEGIIASAATGTGSFLRVRIGDNVYIVHPFDCDYLIGGAWVSGDGLRRAYDARAYQVKSQWG